MPPQPADEPDTRFGSRPMQGGRESAPDPAFAYASPAIRERSERPRSALGARSNVRGQLPAAWSTGLRSPGQRRTREVPETCRGRSLNADESRETSGVQEEPTTESEFGYPMLLARDRHSAAGDNEGVTALRPRYQPSGKTDHQPRQKEYHVLGAGAGRGPKSRSRSIALAAGCALAVVACGSSSKPRNATGSSGSAQVVAYADCMRSHGVQNFPDASSGGGWRSRRRSTRGPQRIYPPTERAPSSSRARSCRAHRPSAKSANWSQAPGACANTA